MSEGFNAIRALGERYSAAACRRSPEGMAAVYAPAGELVAFGNSIKGREMLQKTFEHTCNTFVLINQICSAPIITIDGDTGTSHWNVTETVRRPDNDMLEIFMGDYEDEVVKIGGEWLFSRRILTRRAQVRFPANFRD